MQMQNEFLSRKTQPSAHLVNKRKAEVEENVEMDVSEKIDDSKKLKSTAQDNEEKLPSEPDEKQEIIDTHDIPVTSAFTQILERDIRHAVAVAPSYVTVPFPQAKMRNKKFSSEIGKKSIFAQEMEWLRKKNVKTVLSKSSSPSLHGFTIIDGSGLGDGSSSHSEAQKIHNENMAKIATMPKEEILQCQNELLSQLDPKIVNFLRSKRNPEATSKFTSLKSQNTMEVTSSQNQSTTKIEDDVDMSELPINPEEAKKKYLHMDKVEKDKLAWMTMLPKPKPFDPKTGCAARFDFDGKLVNQDSDISTQEGLHHHGEEPEVPGYTVEELFLLARSSIQSQRVMALQVLARIMRNNWQGLFDDCLQIPLLPLLLDGGIVPLLRWALDDTTESVISAAAFALYGLLVCESDELCLDKVYFWHHGYVTPFLKLPGSPTGNKLDNETSLKELSDAEILKLDVIKGLLRMDILARLRYILEVCKPVSSVVEHILQILICIGRHSLEAAAEVLNFPCLMATIVSEFLPANWGVIDSVQNKVANAYGSPLSYSVKLIRVIASAGRHLSSCLVSDFNIMKSLTCYLIIDPSDAKLPTAEALKLNIESMRTWRILLAYGLSANTYLDLFPVFMARLQFCQSLSINTDLLKHEFDYQYAAALLSNMEAVIAVVASNTALVTERINIEDHPSLPIAWNHVTGLFDIVETCLKKWLRELFAGDTSASGLTLLGSCMDFVSTYFKKFSTQPNCNVVGLLEEIETLYEKCLIPFLQSLAFARLLEQLCSHSLLLSSETLGAKRNGETLGCLGSIMWASDVVPVLKESSPFQFLSSFSNLIITLINLHHSLKKEILKKEFLSHPALIKYLKLLLTKQPSTNVNWFCRFELHFLHHLIILSANSGCDDKVLVHNLSLHVVPLFCEGHEYLLQELLSSVLFHLDFFPEKDNISWAMQQLQLQDKVTLHSATGQVIEVNEWKVSHESCLQFADIRSAYTMDIISSMKIKKNRWCLEQICHLVESLAISGHTQTVLPLDWMFLHITWLYHNSKQGEPDAESSETIATITRCLQWFHLLQVWRSSVVNYISAGIIFCHLSTVFLLGNTLFLNKSIQCYLQASLHQLLTTHPSDMLQLSNSHLSGITSFDDLYSEILTHFEGVSYGDHLFANYVLVPLQQSYGSKWKKMLFSEHSSALHVLGIPLAEVMVPVKKFLNPLEKDEELLTLYCQNVLTGHLQQKRSPLLYLMAIHHLHHFIFTKSDAQTKLKIHLLKHLLKAKNMESAHHIIYYRCPDESSQTGLSIHSSLPDDYKDLISHLLPGYVHI